VQLTDKVRRISSALPTKGMSAYEIVAEPVALSKIQKYIVIL